MTEHEYTDVGIRVKYPESGIPRADKLIITYLDAVKNCALAEGERIEGAYELLECEELVSIRLELRICRGRRIMHIGTLGFTANKRNGRIIGLREAVMREPDGARLSLLTGKRVHRRKTEKKSRQSGEEPKSKTAADTRERVKAESNLPENAGIQPQLKDSCGRGYLRALRAKMREKRAEMSYAGILFDGGAEIVALMHGENDETCKNGMRASEARRRIVLLRPDGK